MNIRIGSQDFDIKEEINNISLTGAGAVVTFTGIVRPQGEQGDLHAMELEHYPGMTESCIAAIVERACQRWQLMDVTVIHRVGHLLPGDNIVFVGVAASHRAAAFAGAEFIMDYLKIEAPFWKKEITSNGDFWIEQKSKDQQAMERWS